MSTLLLSVYNTICGPGHTISGDDYALSVPGLHKFADNLISKSSKSGLPNVYTSIRNEVMSIILFEDQDTPYLVMIMHFLSQVCISLLIILLVNLQRVVYQMSTLLSETKLCL